MRANSGQVVVSPSIHPETGRRYEWDCEPEACEIAEAPAWLLNLLHRPKRLFAAASAIVGKTGWPKYGEATVKNLADEVKSAPNGTRNATLNKAAFRLGQLSDSCEVSRVTAYSALATAAKVCGLGNAEIEATFQSGWEGGLSSPAVPPSDLGDVDEFLAFKHTDLGEGERFAIRNSDTVRFSRGRGWLCWDGRRWKRDDLAPRELVKARVFDICREAERLNLGATSLRTKAAAIITENDGKPNTESNAAADEAAKQATEAAVLSKAARSLSRLGRMLNILEVAKSASSIRIEDESLDCDPMLFNVRNGTIDLHTGRLKPHDRSDLITKVAGVEHDPTAQCPTWLAFLSKVFRDRPAVISFLQKSLGYSLSGKTSEQVFFILYGSGRNGKSVLTNTISELMGEYARETEAEALMIKRTGGAPTNDIAALAGSRFVSANESEDGHRLAEAKVKQMTGGDLITARFLYGEYFSFAPSFKIWLRTNHKPSVRGTDYGFWRRVKLIPFDVVIIDDEVDKDLSEKLRAELPGILNWAIEGCLLWQAEKLTTPDEIRRATEDYREEMDRLSDFLGTLDVLEWKANEIYKAYLEWSKDAGEKPISLKRLGQELTKRGWGSLRKADGMLRIHPEFGVEAPGMQHPAPSPANPPNNSSSAQTGKTSKKKVQDVASTDLAGDRDQGPMRRQEGKSSRSKIPWPRHQS